MNRIKKRILITLLCASLLDVAAQQTVVNFNVIPLPQKIELLHNNPFIINSYLTILYKNKNSKMKMNAEFLSNYLKESIGIQPKINKKSDKQIVLSLDTTIQNKEGYRINVSEKEINIIGATEAGVFYGIQTFRKALPIVKNASSLTVPAVSINDFPRFGYRGMMLDVGRHYFPVEFIKKYIDLLALHNVNRMHWHLTEDQGWRIEIKKYPKLTEIGSIRQETVIGHNSGKFDGKPYGGFYTQNEIKDIVSYASARYITIVPEIDLPGHMLSALASYPDLGCTGGPYKVGTQWGVYNEVLCVGNENTMVFIENVLSELIQLFPSEYIHIGGDECPKTSWKKCNTCQAKINELGLKADAKHSAEDKLQSYCISRAEKFLNSKGRRIIGWDEILEGGLAPNATVMSWRGVNGGIEAAKQRHDVIMTPNSHMYFDHYQSKNKNEPDAIGGYLPVSQVYSYEPIPSVLSIDEQKHILGTQGNLWTEYISTPSQVEYMTLPRLAALCEVQWTLPANKDYSDFLLRLPTLVELYKLGRYNYAKHIINADIVK